MASGNTGPIQLADAQGSFFSGARRWPLAGSERIISRKIADYEALREEIERLRGVMAASDANLRGPQTMR